MIIAVDAMGGDFAPLETVAGAIKFLDTSDARLLLVGPEEIIQKELEKYSYDQERIGLVNASQVMGMDESVAALRKKQDSSIVVATRLVKEGQADAIVSCGSTGAQMAAATLILGRMNNIERPPIVAEVPTITGNSTLLLDVGANVDCRPSQLVQFAILGSVYAAMLTGIDSPRVALLNNGEEEGKGNKLSLESFELLREQKGINFVGNVEAADLFSNKTDIAVCDGFVGNILLKGMEGLAKLIGAMMYKEMGKLPSFFERLDNSKVGGAPLLGINGVSIVCHGSSKRDAICSGIGIAQQCVLKNMVETQKLALSRAL